MDNNKKSDDKKSDTIIDDWIDSTTKYWSKAGRTWPNFSASMKNSEADSPQGNRITESMDAALKNWQTIFATMSKPEEMKSFQASFASLPEISQKMIQSGMESFSNVQQKIMNRISKFGESTSSCNFNDLDQEIFKAWRDVYDTEIKKFFNIPQLGLTRFYQEKELRSMDKFNVFQNHLSEFMFLFFLPVENSFKKLQDHLTKMTEKGTLPESSKELYGMWIKILEGQYMTMLKSHEYTHTMGLTVDSLGDFLMAKEELQQDFLKLCSMPTLKDMDELYKEIYLLKKELKTVKKIINLKFT